MVIKRNISFYLQKIYNGADDAECQIRMRVRWNGNVLQFNCGYTIAQSKWSAASSRCKRNTFNKKGIPSSEINKGLNRIEVLAEDVFKSFEVQEVMPSKPSYKRAFNASNGKNVDAEVRENILNKCIYDFISSQSAINSWADKTIHAFRTLRTHLKNFNPDITMTELNEDAYARFIVYLLEVAGLRNTTVIKTWKLLKWFLRWADKNGYLENKDYIDFNPHLKDVRDREVVFLTWDELMAVYNLHFPDNKKYLERVRDVFCFQCFTSLATPTLPSSSARTSPKTW